MNTYKRIAVVIVAASVALALIAGARAVTSQTTPLTRGVTYLKTTQNGDGSWGGTQTSLNGVFPTTAAAVEALRAVEATASPNQTNAVQFLTTQTVAETPFLAARVIALGGTGSSSVAADVDALIARQNVDGGWGTAEGFESNVPDTALALLALKAANAPNTDALTGALNHLTGRQNTDGGWGLTRGEESQVFYTALALQALNSCRLQFAVSVSQTSAVAFLRGRQNADGGYGGPASTPFETALSLLAIFGAGQSLTPAEASANNYLNNAQQADGSWAGDAYSTALALRALAFPRDTDADGMSDSFETANGLDPNDPADASQDSDADGLTNLEEFRRGTNPKNADTDADGVDDRTEVFSGSDPRDPNSKNRPPVITSQPVTTASEGQIYTYQVQGSDPDNDLPSFSLLQSPAGMSISQAGLIQWTPASNQAGSFTVIIKASDGRGGQALQQYRVRVLAQGVDLAVSGVDASNVTANEQTLVASGTVQVTIENRGGSLFDGQFEVLLFEDRNGDGTYQNGTDSVLGSGTFAGSIASGSTAPLTMPVSGVVQFRDNLIYAFADSAGQIPELSETNNIGSSGGQSKYQPPVGDFLPKVKWQFNSNLSNSGVSEAPLVVPLIDTDGDGLVNERDVPAVIFFLGGNFQGADSHLMAVRGDNGAVILDIPSPYNEIGTGTNPAVGDLDGDGVPEIVVAECCRGVIICFDNNGTRRWTSQPVRFRSSPAIADLDGDGRAEILYGWTIFNFDGTIRRLERPFGVPSNVGGNGQAAAALQVADLDLNGEPEIIAGPAAFDKDGDAIWYWQTVGSLPFTLRGTLDGGATIVNTPNSNFVLTDALTAIANLDDDPNPEIIAVSSNSIGATGICGDTLWIFEHDGRIKSGFPICLYQDVINGDSYQGGPPTVADFDGDGEPEIAIPAQKNVSGQVNGNNVSQTMLAVYEPDGSLKWRRDLIHASSSHGPPPAAAFDFDGDGRAEIVYRDEQKLYIMNGGNGATLYEFGVAGNALATAYPVVADVDNDGLAEIVVPAATLIDGSPPRRGVVVLGDTRGNWRNARRVWNQWLYHVTNVDEDAGIPRAAANNWQTFNNSRTQVSADGVDPLAAPDLTVSKVTINTQGCPASAGITARVGNGGSLHVAAGQEVNFYDGDPASGGSLLGTGRTTHALYPGEFEDVTLANVSPPSLQVFATVGDPRVETLVQSNNLARLPHTWAQASGYCRGCTVIANIFAYRGIDGLNNTRWIENPFRLGDVVPGGPPFYEVRFPVPVNATSVMIQNSTAGFSTSNSGFLTGTLSFSNGFSQDVVFNASGEGTITFPEQQNVSWVRLTAATTRADGPSLSEFVVSGSYTDPQFRLNEGTGRTGNNKAASNFTGSPCDAGANHPPVITSAPPLSAQTAVTYTYQVQTSDPNNDPPSFSLVTAPTGMTIDGMTGLINWAPSEAQTGDSPVTLQVSDGRGGTAEQSFTINVSAPAGTNSPPQFTSSPVTSATPDEAYQYGASATDPDGDTVIFSLLQSPAGAAVDQFTGLVSWAPSTSQVGPQFFTVEAQDGRGGRATQSFAVLVQPVTAPLPAQPLDADGDGFDETEDCDDTKSNVNPGRTEIPGNGLDDDCNPATPDALPTGSLSCSIVTNKRGYDANAPAQLTISIRNLSPTLSISGLQAHLTVSGAGGQSVHTATVPVNSLSPNGLFRATEGFDTGTHPPGTYKASVELRFGSAMVCGSEATFNIHSSAARGRALTGEITASPARIEGAGTTFSYQVSNVGNEDLSALSLKILVVELGSGNEVRALTDQTSLNRGQTFNSSQAFSAAGLKAGDYLAILRGESGGTTQTVSSAFFTVVNQPPVARCQDIVKTADRNVTPQEVGAGSSDPEGKPLSLSLDPAGPYPLGTTAVTLTATDDKGSSSQCTAQVTVDRGTPTISWNNPAEIIYGTALSAAQLNATASFNGTVVPGTFIYTPAAGTVLNVGEGQNLSVSFTPTDATLYTEATAAVAINVLKATPTINVTGGTFTYDGQPHPAMGSVVGIGGEDLGAPTLTYTGSPDVPVSAGAYEVVASFAGNANYTSVENSSASIIINKAPLTIRADDKSKLYGAALPAFTASYSGFVSGQDVSVLSGTLNLNTPATATSNAGTYRITPSGLTSSNYEISFVDGVLTVTKAPLAVTADHKSKVYGASLPVFTASYSGFVLNENQSVLGGALTFSTPATAASDVGAYEVTPGGLDSPNYQITFVDGILTVDKAPLTVMANDQTKLLGAALPVFTASYSGFVLGQNESVLEGMLSFTTAATATSSVGAYAITPGGLTSPNYQITFVDGMLTVTYQICLSYDLAKAHKSGSTIPIKLQLCDANGQNVSSSETVVTALGVALASNDAPGPLEDAGNANPDDNFRFTGFGYIYNLKTTGLGTGTYDLMFKAGQDPVIHTTQFQIK